MTTDHFASAERELAAAINDSTLVDDLPYEEANSYVGRRARYRAKVAMDAAQVHATLALAEQLARLRTSPPIVTLPERSA